MKRTFPTVLVALTVLCSGVLSGPATAANTEHPIAIAAKAALVVRGTEAPGTGDRVPAANSTDQSGAATPIGFSVEALTVVAAEIATAVPVDADALVAAWRTTSRQRLRVMLTALSQVGTAYRYGGNSPGGFDCSGLTSYAWASVGVRLPRTSTLQIEHAVPRDLGQLRPGDVLWRPGHIGISLGIPDVMVNATQTGRPVEVKRWGRVTRSGSPIVD